MTLQAILNCAYTSFDHYALNCDTWSLVRSCCRELLDPEELERYRELYERDDDESRQSEWESLLDMFYPDDEDMGSSDNEGQANLRDDLEIESKTMREKTIAYHQLKAFSLYLEDMPNLTAAYRKFLVSCVYFLWCLHVLQ